MNQIDAAVCKERRASGAKLPLSSIYAMMRESEGRVGVVEEVEEAEKVGQNLFPSGSREEASVTHDYLFVCQRAGAILFE
jgi:hypothetical protein